MTESDEMMEPKEKGYQDLIAWQKAMVLAREVYNVTKGWPRDEAWGLTSQTRRAVVSVPANIAEGTGRTGRMRSSITCLSHTDPCAKSRRSSCCQEMSTINPNRIRSLCFDPQPRLAAFFVA